MKSGMSNSNGDLEANNDPPWLDHLIELLKHSVNSCCAVLPLVDALHEMIEWLEDERPFKSDHKRAWKSMGRELEASLATSGPNVRHLAAGLAAFDIEGARDRSSRTSNVDHLQRVVAVLLSDDGLRASWSDTVGAAAGPTREFWACAQTLLATMRARGEDMSWHLRHLLTGILNDRSPDVDHALRTLGRSHASSVNSDSEGQAPAGMSLVDRIELCAELLRRPSIHGSYVVWFAVDLATISHGVAEAGPISFYDSQWIASTMRQPPDQRSTVRLPEELHNADLLGTPDDKLTLLARVDMGVRQSGTCVERDARQLLGAFLAPVERGSDNDFHLMPGSVVFVNGERASWHRFDTHERPGAPFRLDSVLDDWVDGGGAALAVALRDGANEELNRLSRLIQWDTAHQSADPLATVLVAVRTIETVSQAHLNGVNWFELLRWYAPDLAWDGLAYELAEDVRRALDGYGAHPEKAAQARLREISHDVVQRFGSNQTTHLDQVLRHLPEVCALWSAVPSTAERLTRLLHLWTSPSAFSDRVNVAQSDVDLLLDRVHRVRNAAQHGGPIPDTSVVSVTHSLSQLRRRILADLLAGLMEGHTCTATVEAVRKTASTRAHRLKSEAAPITALDTTVDPA